MSVVLILFLDFILTVFIYLIFPVIYYVVKGRIDRDKAKIISIINSISCTIIYTTFRMVLSGASWFAVGVGPAVLYFFVAMWILTDTWSLPQSEKEEEEEKEAVGFCMRCGNQIFSDDKECSNCGHEITKEIEELGKQKRSEEIEIIPVGICPHCGMENSETDEFCGKCGISLRLETKEIEVIDDKNLNDEKNQSLQFEEKPQKPDYISCPNCGKKNSADNSFCGGCGIRLDEVDTKEEGEND